MNWLNICRLVLAAVLLIATTTVTRADFEVAEGWDLWVTDSGGTSFGGFPFEGVPLGNFNFGAFGGGIQNVGDTDTIIQRLEPAVVGGAGETSSIGIEMVAFQLQSVGPIDLGFGLADHFVTLNEDFPSTGELKVTFDNMDGGTYDSTLDVNFDVRRGGLNGQILFSDQLQLEIDPPGPWQSFQNSVGVISSYVH